MKKNIKTPRVPDIQKMDNDVRRTLAMKVCRSCNVEKELSDFYYNKTKKTYFTECKNCNIVRSSKWNKNNKQRYRMNCKKHKLENSELYNLYKRREYKKNIDRYKLYSSEYRSSKRGKGIRAALNRARQLKKLNATPSWLSKSQLDRMQRIYIECPKGYHVDHIIPITSNSVCGLHVPWNLQYLLAADNIRKRNKF